MTYGEIQRAVLELINQYSIAGETISPAYNNQSDYIHRIPNLINQALVRIRIGPRPEAVFRHLENGDVHTDSGITVYRLPADFWALKSGGMTRMERGTLRPTNRYWLRGRREIAVPTAEDEGYYCEYYRLPALLDADIAPGDPVAEDDEVVQAAILYAAAFLVLPDDTAAYEALFQEYEDRLSLLRLPVTAEVRPVEDVYGGESGWQSA